MTIYPNFAEKNLRKTLNSDSGGKAKRLRCGEEQRTNDEFSSDANDAVDHLDQNFYLFFFFLTRIDLIFKYIYI